MEKKLENKPLKTKYEKKIKKEKKFKRKPQKIPKKISS
jgi:hypothetical protein